MKISPLNLLLGAFAQEEAGLVLHSSPGLVAVMACAWLGHRLILLAAIASQTRPLAIRSIEIENSRRGTFEMLLLIGLIAALLGCVSASTRISEVDDFINIKPNRPGQASLSIVSLSQGCR